MGVSVSGITPAAKGSNWILFDQSGDFSLDNTVMAEIWLVGGGMDGQDGFTDNLEIFHGGSGGHGGNVFKFGRVKFVKKQIYTITVADANSVSETSFQLGQTTFTSGQSGHTRASGGTGGIINTNGGIVNPAPGKNGVATPYGIVGSSGSGGCCAALLNNTIKYTGTGKGGTGAGNSRKYISNNFDWEDLKKFNPNIDAVNYGCGGGGNTYCDGLSDIDVKSHGMKGCVIISYYILENNGENTPECSIRYWNNYNNLNKPDSAALREEVDNLNQRLLNAKTQNKELQDQISDLEKQISELSKQV